jgi:hypothetical protein
LDESYNLADVEASWKRQAGEEKDEGQDKGDQLDLPVLRVSFA